MRAIVLRGARVLGWLLATTIVVLSLVPAELRPETGAPHDLEHFSIFFLTGIAFGFGYARRPIILLVELVIFAAAVEIAQHFVPGRHARLEDFMVDSVALCVGALGGFAAQARAIPEAEP
jgi:VanZ family protein